MERGRWFPGKSHSFRLVTAAIGGTRIITHFAARQWSDASAVGLVLRGFVLGGPTLARKIVPLR